MRGRVTEHWYGDGEPRGENTLVWVKVGPRFPFEDIEYKLLIQGWAIPQAGAMIVRTERTFVLPDDLMDREVSQIKTTTTNGLQLHIGSWTLPDTVPIIATRLTWGPDGPHWTGKRMGHWTCQLGTVSRPTLWERLDT